MKNIFKEAHKMTREMVEKYGVDYQVQFGLCLSYLLENKEEESEMTELEGTEKQIKYANDLLNHLNKYVNRVLEGYKKGEALEEEKEEFNNFVKEVISPIRNNVKSWEVINILKERVKELWYLEDENWMNEIKDMTDDDDVEFEYNVADDIKHYLAGLF